MYEEIEKMYLVYYSELYRYIIKLGGNSDIADDLIQITFVEALKNIESYNARSSLKTWLFSIAKYQLYSYFRKNRIIVSDMIDKEDSKQTDYTDKMLADEIMLFIEQLTPPLNEIMKQRLMYGYSFREIGCKIGKTENYCRVNFYRIKEKLRKEYYYE